MKKPFIIVIVLLVISIFVIVCFFKNDPDKNNFEKSVGVENVSSFSPTVDPSKIEDFDDDNVILTSNDLGSFKVATKQNSIVAHGLDYFNDTYIEVGNNLIKTSKDAITWKTVYTSINSNFFSVTHNNNLVVVVGVAGIIMTSADLNNWQIRKLSTEQDLISVRWIKDSFFIVGSNGTILKSKDAITWESQSVNTEITLRDIFFNNGQFFIVGGEAEVNPFEFKKGKAAKQVILTSVDGINWVKNTFSSDNALSTIIWFNNHFISSSAYEYRSQELKSSNIFISRDNVTWEQLNTNGDIYKVDDFEYSNSMVVGVGDGIIVSDDGYKWRKVDDTKNLDSVIWDGKKFIALSCFGQILSSNDGLSWELLNMGDVIINGIASDGKKYLVGGSCNSETQLFYSMDCIHWKKIKSISDMDNIPNMNNICSLNFVNNKFVITTGFNNIFVSDNGLEWEMINTNTHSRINKIAYGSNQYIAVGSDDPIIKSQDLKNWSVVEISVDNALSEHRVKTNGFFRIYDIIWKGDEFVTACYCSTIITSRNGSLWNINHFNAPTGMEGFISIAWGSGKYVAIGNNSISYSGDNINWKSHYLYDCNLTSISYYNNMFVATGYRLKSNKKQPFVLTSRDGVSWGEKSIKYGTEFKKVFWDGKMYIII